MRELGITGAVRGKKMITTTPDPTTPRAPDLVDRDFVAPAPNRCWVADFTPRHHVRRHRLRRLRRGHLLPPHRRLVRLHTTKQTRLVLDALDMGLRQRDREQYPPLPSELIHHADAGSQHTFFTLAVHLEKAGIAASIGSVGDAYDKR
ncbi:hypothetical protein [Streptomyces sp. NPDC019539]|uniref:hypothetical protein n=1 Tax=Streptomyces sp. NPDC019539 TaxID=3365063 RepID=UPI0037A415AE